jgi:hypothetical protein
MVSMEFSVNTKALSGLAEMLDRRHTDLRKTADYLNAQSVLEWGPGLLNNLRGAHQQIVTETYAFLRRAADSYLFQYSGAIDAAIQDYNSSDLAANGRVDAILPGAANQTVPALPSADPTLGPDIFDDPAKLVLKIPPDYRADFPYEPSWFDQFSPTSWGRDVIWRITSFATTLGVLDHPIDPAEAFTLPLCGDWPGLERYSFALKQAAQALSFVGQRVDSGAVIQDRVWTGHAATNCATALGRFTLDLKDAEGILLALAGDYHDLAVAARDKGRALASMVCVIGDIVGSFGLELIFEAPRVIEAAEEAATVLPDIVHGIEGLHATIEGGKSLGEFRANDLSRMLTSSMNGHLPADMPVLPTPAHRR